MVCILFSTKKNDKIQCKEFGGYSLVGSLGSVLFEKHAPRLIFTTKKVPELARSSGSNGLKVTDL